MAEISGLSSWSIVESILESELVNDVFNVSKWHEVDVHDQTESIEEELANFITHFIGIPLSILGAYEIWKQFKHASDVWVLMCYCISLFCVYFFSTSYHLYGFWLRYQTPDSTLEESYRTPGKMLLKYFDKCAIYLLIAGTYSPFLLIPLCKQMNGKYRMISQGMFILIWMFACIGVVMKSLFATLPLIVDLGLYLGMAYVSLLSVHIMVRCISGEGITLLIIGGFFYTFGALVFFASHDIPFNHSYWHLCVVMGSVFHWLAIYRAIVIPYQSHLDYSFSAPSVIYFSQQNNKNKNGDDSDNNLFEKQSLSPSSFSSPNLVVEADTEPSSIPKKFSLYGSSSHEKEL